MKYGNCFFTDSHPRGISSQESTLINIGDYLQFAAIDHIYNLMEIRNEDRIEIDFYSLDKYVGEYVILPINFLVSRAYLTNNVVFSPYIIPVFLGVGILAEDHSLSAEVVEYLKRFAPIGCRDAHTLGLMRQYNISAYLNGCLTLAVTERRQTPCNGGTPYFVDAPSSLKKFVPNYLKEKAVFRTHGYYEIPEEVEQTENGPDFKKWALSRISEYKKEASILISSRLHAIVPAVAAGIPVIAVARNFDSRNAWLDKYIPLYNQGDFEEIDWNPSPVEIEEIKERIVSSAIKRIQSVFNLKKDELDISWHYESRNSRGMIYRRPSYAEDAIFYIKQNWSKEKKINYAFWGLTETSILLYDYIRAHYPNAVLVKVYDAVTSKTFNGIIAERPSDMPQGDEAFLFVTSDTACGIASTFLASKCKDPKLFFLCKSKVLGTEDFFE